MPKGDKKKKNSGPVIQGDRSLLEKEDGTEYGIVTKVLGGGRFSVKLNLQHKEVIGKICGKLKYKGNKKSNFIELGSVVLVGVRDFQDKVVDIVYLYTPEEVKKMKKSGMIAEENTAGDDIETLPEIADDTGFDFDHL